MSEDWYEKPTKLQQKQQERREFIYRHCTAIEAAHLSGYLSRENCQREVKIDATLIFKNAIKTWNEIDKQLTEMEKGERE